jgi:hypothetical protein
LEKGLSLTRPGGRLGYIVSASFLVQATFSKLRALLLESGNIEQLAPMGPKVFDRASVDSCIVVIRRGKQLAEHRISVRAPIEPILLPRTASYEISQSRFADNASQVFDFRLTDEAAALIDRLSRSFDDVESGFEFGVGINTGYIRDELTSDHRIDERWHPMVPGTGIARYGTVRTHGWIMYDTEFVRSRGSRARSLPQEHLLSSEKILVVRTRNLSIPRRIVATIDASGAYNLNRLSNIVARPGHDLYGLLGILNSRLFDWIFSTRFYDYEIKPVYLRACPLADDCNSELVSGVKEILATRQAETAARTTHERNRIHRELALIDKKIDRMVYRLYRISEHEQSLIEEQMKALDSRTESEDFDGAVDVDS